MTTLQTANISESCYALDTTSDVRMGSTGPRPIVCSVSLYWDPTIWSKLFTTPRLYPVAGFYCAEVCAHFPTPIGYRMQDCQFVDRDECAEARAANTSICARDAACINRRIPQNSSLEHVPQGTLDSTGYMCMCLPGYFTVGIAPTSCEGKGVEVIFFFTETANLNVTVEGDTSSNRSNSTASAPAISVFFTLQTLRQRVISRIQTEVAGMNVSTSAALFAASSLFADNSVTFKSAGNATVWKMKIYIAAAFVHVRNDTFANIASIIQRIVTDNPLARFRLHTQTICGGLANGSHAIAQIVCTADDECTSIGAGLCARVVTYIQAHLVDTSSQRTSIDSQSAGFVLLSVRFNMAALVWVLELQFQDYDDGGRRVLFVSKTQKLNGVVAYVPQGGLPCADGRPKGQSVYNAQQVHDCFSGLSDRYHVLQSFRDQFILNGPMAAEQQTKLQNGFPGTEDFATGRFSSLPSATAAEANYLFLNDASAAAQGTQLVTTSRVVLLTLTYAEVLDSVGTHATRGLAGSEINVDFFVGMATILVRDGQMTTALATRDILTKLGTNYVLSHDLTDDSLNGIVVPSIAVSLYNVYSRTLPALSWGFISYTFQLPANAIAAGITFDQRDAIPIDSVVGSIGFFQDDPLHSNEYPCIFRPAAESYTIFAARTGCSNAINSVRFRAALCFVYLPPPQPLPVFVLYRAATHSQASYPFCENVRQMCTEKGVVCVFRSGAQSSQIRA